MIPRLDRASFGYVVRVEGRVVTLNLHDAHRGHRASHGDGIAAVSEYGSIFAIDGGARLFVMRVGAVLFAEAEAAHRRSSSSIPAKEPLRHLKATVLGMLERTGAGVKFDSAAADSPVLGAEAYPLSEVEYDAVLRMPDGAALSLGQPVRGGSSLSVSVAELLSRHVAVLGSSGSGKSCFTASILQQLSRFPNARVVVFDLNDEYDQALLPYFSGGRLKITTLGTQGEGAYRIPYYALGRHGLGRLLVPSEKTQRPALNFALNGLRHVEVQGDGVALAGTTRPVLFDSCPQGNAADGLKALDDIRTGRAKVAKSWPSMRALAALVADSQAIQPGRNGPERNAFNFGNVAPLVNRIHRRCEDHAFREVVDVDGGPGVSADLRWEEESAKVVAYLFGADSTDWNVHIIKLNRVANDLLPYVLGSLLELFAHQLFVRGQGGTHPTLLVLEEAHNYLRELDSEEDGAAKQLSYERLAKEGRKFGVSLWLSTQRPSEVSPTVLSQCATWCVFRVTGEADRRAVAAAAEWPDKNDVEQVASLPRQQLLVFGQGTSIPTRITAARADPLPRSMDPPFAKWS